MNLLKNSQTNWKYILIVVVLAFFVGGGILGYQYWWLPKKEVKISEVKPPEQITKDETADWKTYTNNTYGFSFEYPKAWESTKKEKAENIDESGYPASVKENLIFKVSFADPESLKKIEKANCVNNEQVGWRNPQPTKSECQSILDKLSTTEKEDLLLIDHPYSAKNIFVRVDKNTKNQTVKDWLTNSFHIAGTELQDYKVGSKITLAGIKGYFSNIGCCGGSDRNYVVGKNGYVYSLGTNYFDKNSERGSEKMPDYFVQIASTFQFTK